MNIEIRDHFIQQWKKYFNNADLPITFYYTKHPRAVIGMFDVSARPCVQEGILSFSVPMVKFTKMISYMDESFLITNSWKKVQKRIM